MQCDAFCLLQSVVADGNTIQMWTQKLQVWAENAGVGVSQRIAEIMRIWQDMGGLITQRLDNKGMDRIWGIAQSMTITTKEGAGPNRLDLQIDHCDTTMCEL
jgi:hypothetical protein